MARCGPRASARRTSSGSICASANGRDSTRPTNCRQAIDAGIYQLMSDSKNNLWMAEFEEGYLGKIDAKTTEVTWYAMPSPHARARRMEIDDQDRILVTEYRANKVALFDTKTEKFTEYSLPPHTRSLIGRRFRQERRTLGLHA